MSGLRLGALSSIDYSDITFNVPTSLIFSGLEPCLAVALACVPVLRPLLGKFGGSTVRSTGLSSGKLGSNKFSSSKNKDFEQLNDDSSSQCQLRPLGPKHVAEARAQQRRGSWSGAWMHGALLVYTYARKMVELCSCYSMDTSSQPEIRRNISDAHWRLPDSVFCRAQAFIPALCPRSLVSQI